MKVNHFYHGDALEVLKTLPDESVDMCITSPPYWALRDYGVEGQLGLELTFQEYINKLCDIFDEVKRVLKKEGTCWVNLGDTYGGSGKGAGAKLGKESWNFDKAPKQNVQSKSLIQIPSRFAIEMTDRGWILRNELIWHKPNCMPSSVKDRFTVDFEKIFFFVKNKKYWFDTQREPHKYLEQDSKRSNFNAPSTTKDKHLQKEAVGKTRHGRKRSDDYHPLGRNKRAVWKITTKPYKEAHFAVYPQELIETPIKAGCPKNGVVLDPFMGSGTTALVARYLERKYIGIELNEEYIALANKRIRQKVLL